MLILYVCFDFIFVSPPLTRTPPLFSKEGGAGCVDDPLPKDPLSHTRTLGRSGCGLRRRGRVCEEHYQCERNIGPRLYSRQ